MQYLDYIIVFVLVFVTDICYPFYLKSVARGHAIRASLWASFVSLTASVALIDYVGNPWLLVPSLLAAFTGTYVGMKLHLR